MFKPKPFKSRGVETLFKAYANSPGKGSLPFCNTPRTLNSFLGVQMKEPDLETQTNCRIRVRIKTRGFLKAASGSYYITPMNQPMNP